MSAERYRRGFPQPSRRTERLEAYKINGEGRIIGKYLAASIFRAYLLTPQ